MRTVHLYGRLGEEFGRRFELKVDSVAEAARALEANFPGRFYEAIRNGAYHLVRGQSHDDGETLDESLLGFRYGAGDFHIVPVVAGSGGNTKGIITIVIGVVIIAAALVLTAGAAAPGLLALSAPAFTIFGATVSIGQLALLGVAMTLSGVSTLLTPTPKAPKFKGSEKKENFFFNGPINVAVQGGPVPVVYGRARIGSTVVSGGTEV